MKNNFVLIAFALLTLSLLYFVKSTDPESHPRKANHAKTPQEYMIEAFVSIFSEDGFLKEELSTNHWAYLPESQLSTLIQPHLTVYKPDGTVWLIDAKRGLAKQPTLGTIEQIELQNEVMIERPATTAALPLKLESNQLKYYPKKQYVENEQPVTINKPGLKITGVGLRAFLDQNLVELLHDVKTYYAPHS